MTPKTPITPETQSCDDLDEFAAGELSPSRADGFRRHLATCDQCPAELSTILQFSALARADSAVQRRPVLTLVASGVSPSQPDAPIAGEAPIAAGGPPPIGAGSSGPLPPTGRRWSARSRWWAAGALVAAASLVLLIRLGPTRPPELLSPDRAAFTLAETHRSIEGRLTLAWADHYRPFNAGQLAEAHREMDYQFVAEQQKRGDQQGLATSHLMVRELGRARAALARAPDSRSVRSDRAALDLEQHNPTEALTLADGVLAAEPRHPQALWNRAIALDRMGLDRAAAQAFDRVAALGEAGWSDEARTRARALRAQAKARHDTWEQANAAGAALIDRGAPVPAAYVQNNPDIIRTHFYDALNSAPSKERVLALLPLAQKLDASAHDGLLEALVAKVARADFKVRAPLGRQFLEILRERVHLDDKAFDRYLAKVREANQPDLLLGAISFARDKAAHRAEMQRLDEQSGDPWYIARAHLVSAKAKADAGALRAATEELRSSLAECRTHRIELRCAQLSEALVTLYNNRVYLPVASRNGAEESRQRARSGQLYERELLFLQFLADTARYERSFSVAHAYLDEVALAEPDNCLYLQTVHLWRSIFYLHQGRPADARREAHALRACAGEDLSVAAADTLAELAHWDGTDEEARSAREIVHVALKHPRPGEGGTARLNEIEGRLLAEREPDAAQAYLKAAIADANHADATDAPLLRARVEAYSTRIWIDGRAGRWADALAIMAEERAVAAPANCALGVSVDYDRVLVVARDARGEPSGTYEHHHAGAINPPALVGAEMIAGFAACRSVEVYARPPLQGLVDLLPPQVPWTYRTRRDPPPPASAEPPKRLIVSGIRAPDWLSEEMAPTARWAPPAAAGVVDLELTSPDATPARVRDQMADATDIEIHAHGALMPDHSNVASLVLSPDDQGSYALTDGDVRQTLLRRAPIVYLASCGAALTSPASNAASLPMAFLGAGARAVLASPSPMDDGEAGPFYDAVRARIAAGAPPAEALRDAKLAWLAKKPESLVKDVLMFQ